MRFRQDPKKAFDRVYHLYKGSNDCFTWAASMVVRMLRFLEGVYLSVVHFFTFFMLTFLQYKPLSDVHPRSSRRINHQFEVVPSNLTVRIVIFIFSSIFFHSCALWHIYPQSKQSSSLNSVLGTVVRLVRCLTSNFGEQLLH